MSHGITIDELDLLENIVGTEDVPVHCTDGITRRVKSSNLAKNKSIEETIELLKSVNNVYSNDMKTSLLDDLVENEDISSRVNEELLKSDVFRVVIPKGNYTVSETIVIPEDKILVLQGSYKDNGEIYHTVPRTIIKPSNDNMTIFQLKPKSTIDGGFIDISNKSNIVAILLNLYNEKQAYTRAINTMILGNRQNNTIGVMLECDDPNGIEKSGYSVFCNFDLSIRNCSIGYHLHRENASITDGPSEIVWCTEMYIRGYITHCNRYIWFDCIGGWGGDSSFIYATLQCGAIIGEDLPGIELNCSDVCIYGNLWDFGGYGLQQKSLKLNSNSKKNIINNPLDRTVEDLGKDNIFLKDLHKINSLNTNRINRRLRDKMDNSLLGNEERLNYEIKINYLDNTTRTITDIYQLPYGSEGFYCDGVKGIEYLFKENCVGVFNTKLHGHTSFDTTKVSSMEIKFIFMTYVSLTAIGTSFIEKCLPHNFKIEILTNKGQNISVLDKTYQAYNNNYTDVFSEYINLIDEGERFGSLDFFAKQQTVKEIKLTYTGYSDEPIVRMQNIILDIQEIKPDLQPKYLIDCKTYSMKYKNLEDIFGETIYEYDFSVLDVNDMTEIFFYDPQYFNLVKENNYISVNYIGNTAYQSLSMENFDQNLYNVVFDVSFKVNSPKIYKMGQAISSSLTGEGRKLLFAHHSSSLVTMLSSLNDDEYFRVHKIIVFKDGANPNIDYREIQQTFFNNYL